MGSQRPRSRTTRYRDFQTHVSTIVHAGTWMNTTWKNAPLKFMGSTELDKGVCFHGIAAGSLTAPGGATLRLQLNRLRPVKDKFEVGGSAESTSPAGLSVGRS